MQLRFNKTLSQHQLAVKLRLEPAEKKGLLSWEQRGGRETETAR